MSTRLLWKSLSECGQAQRRIRLRPVTSVCHENMLQFAVTQKKTGWSVDHLDDKGSKSEGIVVCSATQKHTHTHTMRAYWVIWPQSLGRWSAVFRVKHVEQTYLVGMFLTLRERERGREKKRGWECQPVNWVLFYQVSQEEKNQCMSLHLGNSLRALISVSAEDASRHFALRLVD